MHRRKQTHTQNIIIFVVFRFFEEKRERLSFALEAKGRLASPPGPPIIFEIPLDIDTLVLPTTPRVPTFCFEKKKKKTFSVSFLDDKEKRKGKTLPLFYCKHSPTKPTT